MDNPRVSYIIGAFAVVFLIFRWQWSKKENASTNQRFLKAIVPAAAAGLTAFGAAYGWQLYNSFFYFNQQLDRLMAETEQSPLIGAILKDQPQYIPELREAFQSDATSPMNPPRSRQIIKKLRTDFFVSAIWGAPDETVLAAVEQMSKMQAYLQATDVKLCREFALEGLQNEYVLPAQGKPLLSGVLKALGNVYLG